MVIILISSNNSNNNRTFGTNLRGESRAEDEGPSERDKTSRVENVPRNNIKIPGTYCIEKYYVSKKKKKQW